MEGDRSETLLRSQDKDHPFCLSVSFNAPHAEDSDKQAHYPWPKAVDGLYIWVSGTDVKAPTSGSKLPQWGADVAKIELWS